MISKQKIFTSRLFNRTAEAVLLRDSLLSNSVSHEDDEVSVASEEAMSGHSDASNPITSANLESYINIVRNNPIQDIEIDATLQTLQSRPDVLNQFGVNLKPEQVKDVFEGARAILMDTNLIESVVQLMQSGPAISSLPQEGTKETVGKVELPQSPRKGKVMKTFESIREQYQCTICIDLLAAPVLLNCSHSLCGACYQEMKNICLSSDIETVPCCPLDRIPIKNVLFERVLDDAICKEVSELPNSREKSSWTTRRNQYFENIKGTHKPQASSKRFAMSETLYLVAAIAVISLMTLCMSRMHSH